MCFPLYCKHLTSISQYFCVAFNADKLDEKLKINNAEKFAYFEQKHSC